MTSDAKVGLLLGLVFIVIIAFLINGLPNILKNDPGPEITRNTDPDLIATMDGGVKNHANEVIRTVAVLQNQTPIRQAEPAGELRSGKERR